MNTHDDEIEAAGLNIKDVERIAKGLSRYAKQAQAMGISIFGGAGSGSLRFDDEEGIGSLILADLDGDFNGGDGAATENDDGLLRGEF